jgi:hypothetical protein
MRLFDNEINQLHLVVDYIGSPVQRAPDDLAAPFTSMNVVAELMLGKLEITSRQVGRG